MSHEVIVPGLCNRLEDGRYEFFFDNFTITSFSTCELYFKYRHIDCIAGKGRSITPAIGIWWHETLGRFYKAFANGLPKNEEFLLMAIEAWKDLDMNAFQGYDSKKFDRFGGAEGAMLMASQYYNQYAVFDFRNWQVVSVEAGFGYDREVLVGESSNVVVYYTGRPDVIVWQDKRLTPVETKTVDRIDGQTQLRYKPHSQSTGYAYSAEVIAKKLGIDATVDRVIVNVCARQEPSDNPRDGKPKPRFVRVFPHFSQEEILEWRDQKIKQAERLRYCIENNVWVKKESSCHLYGGCEYRRIDSVAPSSRPIIIQADYTKVEHWSPYIEEE